MNEFIEEYGSLIVEAITAAVIIGMMNYSVAAGAAAVDRNVISDSRAFAKLPSYIDEFADAEGPELTVKKEIRIATGGEPDLKSIVLSAFGNKSFRINILSKEECRTTDSIREALKKGYVNIAYYHDITGKPGKFRLSIYAREEGGIGKWTEASCMVICTEELLEGEEE